jgi:hypothetical protein
MEDVANIPTFQDVSYSNPKNAVAHPSTLVINSEQFTVWKEHHTRLRAVVADWEPQGGRLLTLGTTRRARIIISATCAYHGLSWFTTPGFL